MWSINLSFWKFLKTGNVYVCKCKCKTDFCKCFMDNEKSVSSICSLTFAHYICMT